MPDATQAEFGFEGTTRSDGLDAWHAQRRAALRELGQHVGLPLGREVEVRFADGVSLRGVLRPKEELLFLDATNADRLELQIGRVVFRAGDIAACVRLD